MIRIGCTTSLTAPLSPPLDARDPLRTLSDASEQNGEGATARGANPPARIAGAIAAAAGARGRSRAVAIAIVAAAASLPGRALAATPLATPPVLPAMTLAAAAPLLAQEEPVLFMLAKPGEIDLKVEISVPESPLSTGTAGEAVVTLTPPSGIHLNKYPPIRVTMDEAKGIVFDPSTVKVGLEAMPDDPEQNPFKKVDPIHLKFTVGDHDGDSKIPVKGKLRFYYCVAASGFCAPGSKEITFTIPVTKGS
jgi:hypothetical protein